MANMGVNQFKHLKSMQTLSRTKKFAHFYEVYHDTA